MRFYTLVVCSFTHLSFYNHSKCHHGENKQQLPGLTNQIINTYEDLGTINHLDHIPLPLDKIIEILNDFKEVLYPGYRRRQGLHGGNVSYYGGILSTGYSTNYPHRSPAYCNTKMWSSNLAVNGIHIWSRESN